MKRNGFTVIELVIIVAVVAILAAVLIPTFSTIIENANISADTQATRNMNTFLSSEVAKGNAPAGGDELITLLEENGISKFRPQTIFFTFYWLIDENVIVLVNDDGDIIYPEDYVDKSFNKDTWINLEVAKGMPPLPTAPSESIEEPREFTISVRQPGASEVDFGIPQTIMEGEAFNRTITLEGEWAHRYRIKKVTVLMEEGDGSHKIDIMVQEGSWWDGSYSYGEHPVIDIPCVTGNISINVSFKEFCCITLIANDPSHLTDPEKGFRIWCERGMTPHIIEHMLKGGSKGENPWLAKQYRIADAEAYIGDKFIGNYFDKKTNEIFNRDFTITSDMTIKLTTEWITYNVKLIVKDQRGNILHESEQTAEYNIETNSTACSIVMPDSLKNYEVYHSAIIPLPKEEEPTPTYKRDPESGLLNISNITYDFTLTYFVTVPG